MEVRIRKSIQRRLGDLKDYLENLERALSDFQNGHTASFKNILSNLRVLLINKSRSDKGLILSLADELSEKPKVFFAGMKGIPTTNPLSRDRVLTFSEYIDSQEVLVGDKSYKVKEFVWDLASQDGSHSDEGISPELAVGENIIIGGKDINKLEILSIARTVLSVGMEFLRKQSYLPSLPTTETLSDKQ